MVRRTLNLPLRSWGTNARLAAGDPWADKYPFSNQFGNVSILRSLFLSQSSRPAFYAFVRWPPTHLVRDFHYRRGPFVKLVDPVRKGSGQNIARFTIKQEAEINSSCQNSTVWLTRAVRWWDRARWGACTPWGRWWARWSEWSFLIPSHQLGFHSNYYCTETPATPTP